MIIQISGSSFSRLILAQLQSYNRQLMCIMLFELANKKKPNAIHQGTRLIHEMMWGAIASPIQLKTFLT